MGTMCGDMEPETRLVQNNKTITYVMNDWKKLEHLQMLCNVLTPELLI